MHNSKPSSSFMTPQAESLLWRCRLSSLMTSSHISTSPFDRWKMYTGRRDGSVCIQSDYIGEDTTHVVKYLRFLSTLLSGIMLMKNTVHIVKYFPAFFRLYCRHNFLTNDWLIISPVWCTKRSNKQQTYTCKELNV